VIIIADENSLARMLNVPAAQIPESVLAEYELRLHLFHCDGHSGPLGTLGLICMLRSMDLGRPPPAEQRVDVDWSRIPTNGSVRVEARIERRGGEAQWVSGVYAGQVGPGKLRRDNVRIARHDEPARRIAPEDAVESNIPLAEREPWVSMSDGEVVMVEDTEGHFQGVRDDEILVVVGDDLTPRAFAPELVICLESRLQEAAKE